MSGNKLFVAEEEEEEENIINAVPQNNDAVDAEGDIDMMQESSVETQASVTVDTEPSASATTEAVAEESEEEEEEEEEEAEDENDPIVESFPIYLGGRDEQLHILQYANKPRTIGRKMAEHPLIAAARYKNKSGLWELDIPLNEEAFYNKNKAEEDWGSVNIQTLKGVGVENEGQYAAFVHNNRLYMVPVKTVSQLRPYFKYIDTANQQSKSEDYKQNSNSASQKAQVVTMSVKSANDPSQNRLTGSLLAHKIADEEDPVDLQWVEGTFDQFKDTIIKDSKQHAIQTTDDKDSYVTKLFK